MRVLRWPLVVLLAVGLLSGGIAAAHGGKDGKASHPIRANGTDRAFVGLMTPHHASGIELGQLAVAKGTNPSVVRLGREIVEEQSAELELLNSWAARLKVGSGMPDAIHEREMIDMEKLRAASGTDFDRLWLDVISAHHMGAIQMALMEENGGAYGPAVKLAESIVESQSVQMEEFNALTRALGG